MWVRVQYGDLDGYVMAGIVTLHQELLVKPVYGKDLLGGAGAVRELQANLISLGYLDGTATGIYDLATIGAVKAFQQASARRRPAKPRRRTLEASRQEDAPTGTRVTLSLGDSGKAVRALQEALQALKFYDGGLDGVYDEDVARGSGAVPALLPRRGLPCQRRGGAGSTNRRRWRRPPMATRAITARSCRCWC